MAFFDELKSKVETAANATADKAKEVAEVAKLKSEIVSQEHAITASYLEIGKALYEQEKDKPDSPVADACASIATAQAAIEDLKARIEALKAN
jgi:hypothetical protein